MTKLLEQAIARLRALPRDEQDVAAALVIDVIAQDAGAVQLTPEQQAEVRLRIDQPAELAPHDQVAALFKKSAV